MKSSNRRGSSMDRKRRESNAATSNEKMKSRAKALKTQMTRLKNDTVVLKKNIAKLETLLRVHNGLTEENRRNLEAKLKSWYDLLNNVHVAESEEEKQMRYAGLKQNQGLRDVFDLFWLLVLPYCELDPIENTRILEARAKKGKDRKRRGAAIGSGSQSQSFLSGITGDTGDEEEEPKIVYLTKRGYMCFYMNMYIALTDNRNEKQYVQHAKDAWQQEMLVALNEQRAVTDGDEGSLVGSMTDGHEEGVKNTTNSERVNKRKVTMSKERFFSNLYDILDVWAELLDPRYQTIFAWSLLESIADLKAYPPKLRLPREVTCNTGINNEANMLHSFRDGGKMRSFLSVKNDAVTRIPDVLSRLAARKKGGTLSEEEALQVHQIYLELKRQGKLFQNDATAFDTDDDDDDDLSGKGDDDNSDDSLDLDFNDDDDDGPGSDGEGGRRGKGWRDKYRKRKLTGRKIYAGAMDVKSNTLARLRQREKFNTEDKFDMKNARKSDKFLLADPAQAQSVMKLMLNKKLSSEDANEQRRGRLYNQALKSPVIKGFKYKGGHLAHWQYASSAIPLEDEEEELAAFLKQREKEDEAISQRREYGMVLVERTGQTLGDTSTDNNNFYDLYKDEKLKARLAKIRKFLGISVEGDQFESIILDRLKATEASKQQEWMQRRASRSEDLGTRRRSQYREAMKVVQQAEQGRPHPRLDALRRQGEGGDFRNEFDSDDDDRMNITEKAMLTKVSQIQRLLTQEGAYDIHELMTMAMTDMTSDEDKMKLAEAMATRGNDVFGEETYQPGTTTTTTTTTTGRSGYQDQRKRSVLISEMNIARKNSVLHDASLMKMINRPIGKKKRNTMMNPVLEPLFATQGNILGNTVNKNVSTSSNLQKEREELVLVKEKGEGSRDLDLASINTPAAQLLTQLSQELSVAVSGKDAIKAQAHQSPLLAGVTELGRESRDTIPSYAPNMSALYSALITDRDSHGNSISNSGSWATYDQLIGLQQGVIKQIEGLRPVMEQMDSFKGTPLEGILRQHESRQIAAVVIKREQGGVTECKPEITSVGESNHGEDLPPLDDSVCTIESLKSIRAPSPGPLYGPPVSIPLEGTDLGVDGSTLAVIGIPSKLNVTDQIYDNYNLASSSMMVRGEEILAGGWDIDWAQLDNWLNINNSNTDGGIKGAMGGSQQEELVGRWDENIKELGDFYRKDAEGSKPGTPVGGSPMITSRKGSRQSSREGSRQGTPRLNPTPTAPVLSAPAVTGERGSVGGEGGSVEAHLSWHVRASLNRLHALHGLSIDSGAPLEIDVYSWIYSLPGLSLEGADPGLVGFSLPPVNTTSMVTSATFPSKLMLTSLSQDQLHSTSNDDRMQAGGGEGESTDPEVHLSPSAAHPDAHLTVSFGMDNERARHRREKLARKAQRRAVREMRKQLVLTDIFEVREEGLSRFKTPKLQKGRKRGEERKREREIERKIRE